MEVTTRAVDEVNAFTTADKYFKMALVTRPMYTRLWMNRNEWRLPDNSSYSIDIEVIQRDLLNGIISIFE